MAYIELSAGADMFQHGYNTGFQNGFYEQKKDPENWALTLHQDTFMWAGGYDVGFRCGREYRLAKTASLTMLTHEMVKHTREQKRLEQKHSSVLWFVFWSLIETTTRLVQKIKAIW